MKHKVFKDLISFSIDDAAVYVMVESTNKTALEKVAELIHNIDRDAEISITSTTVEIGVDSENQG